jgi:tetratricopeptide (TPR) repeat protein
MPTHRLRQKWTSITRSSSHNVYAIRRTDQSFKMKTLLVQFIFFIAGIAPIFVFAQEDSSHALASIDKYALHVEIDTERHNLQGEARLQVQILKDSVSRLQFTLGSSMTLLSVHDSTNRKIETADEPSGISRREISLAVPDTVKRGDIFFLRIAFEAGFDSVVSHSSFIGSKEILLSANGSGPWWPVLSAATNPGSSQAATVLLEVTLPSAFTVVSNGELDSIRTVGSKTTQRFVYKNTMPLRSCFLLCGSTEFTQRSIIGTDSSFRCTLYYYPGKFSNEFALSVMQQLRNAHAYFSTMASPDSGYDSVRIAVVGDDDGHGEWYSNNGLMIARNSYSYSSADSTAPTSPERNKWVHELARFFGLAVTDSTFLFDGGWSEYLTTKFFLHEADKNGDAQQLIRLGLLSRTLNFYPSQTLAQEHRSAKNEQAVFFSKGAYVFLMLEYVVGEAAFDSVARKLYRNFKYTPVSIQAFQQICEEAYGSPLDWFFKEWVYQTGFPELILSTECTQTNRGSYSLKAKVSQRGDLFTTPVDLVFSNSARSTTKRIFVERQDQEFEFILPFLPTKSELDPKYYVLRWVPRLRLLAHARTSVSFRVFDKDTANSVREANILLQLDPNNITGWNNIALFSLGKAAVIKGELVKAEEYFRRASALDASEPTQLYSVLSLVRLGNVLEMEGKRDEAVELYKLGAALAGRNTLYYGIALMEAQKYLRQKFVSSNDFWYGEY